MATVITATSSRSTQCRRRWRRTISVSIFVSLKKSTDQLLPQGFSRTTSSRSYCAIDVPSDGGEEEHHQRDPRSTIQQIVQERSVNLLRAFGGLKRVASVLGSDLLTGIKDSKYPEVYNPVDSKGFCHFFWKACNSYTIFLLLISSVLSFGLGFMKEGPKDGWHEGVSILIAVFLLVTLPAIANFRRAKKELLRSKNRVEVKVLRGGQPQLVSICDVVEGDMVCLEKNSRLIADGLLVSDEDLELDDVLDSEFTRDQKPFLFSGSKVINGCGNMIVTSVGNKTELGKAMSLVSHEPDEKALFQARIDKPNAYTDKFSLYVSIIILLVLSVRFLFRKHDEEDGLPDLKARRPLDQLIHFFESLVLKPKSRICMLTSSLTAVMIGLQHGMPLVITFSLSYWNEKAAHYQTEPQNLSACGTTGLATVICVDITGGILVNQMEVDKFWIGGSAINSDEGFDLETSPELWDALRHGVGASGLVPEISTCSMVDCAVSWMESKWGIGFGFLKESFTVLDHRKLRSNKRSTGILITKNGSKEQNFHSCWKGSATVILNMCSHYYDCQGEIHCIKNQKSKFERLVKDMETNSRHGGSIAFAYRQTGVEELKEDGLILLAIVGLRYQCPEKMKAKLKSLIDAGVSIKLLSGDELSVAEGIASDLDIYGCDTKNNWGLEGIEFNSLPSDERLKRLDHISLMVGSLPEHKLLMVKSLKEIGHVVVFVGGLRNSDTPALREADVGVCVKAKSTEMARLSSDVVVTDNNLCPLVSIFRFGQCAYHNIQKFIQLGLSNWISGLLISSVLTMTSGETPLSAVQLFWVNFIMCILAFPMLLMEPPQSQELKTNKQTRRSDSIITNAMLRNLAIQVSYVATVLLIFQFMDGAMLGLNQNIKNAMIFNSFTLCQFFNLFDAMDLKKKKVLTEVLKDFKFLLAVGLVGVMQVLVVEFGDSLAYCERLNCVHWIVCILIASLSWAYVPALELITLLLKWSVNSLGSNIWSFPSTQLPWLIHLGIPFSMFLFISISCFFVSYTALELTTIE